MLVGWVGVVVGVGVLFSVNCYNFLVVYSVIVVVLDMFRDLNLLVKLILISVLMVFLVFLCRFGFLVLSISVMGLLCLFLIVVLMV